MNLECILYEKDDGVAIIRLNRPKVLNAMNKQLWLDFQAALEMSQNDPAIKVLIITGAGPGLFHRRGFEGIQNPQPGRIPRLSRRNCRKLPENHPV